MMQTPIDNPANPLHHLREVGRTPEPVPTAPEKLNEEKGEPQPKAKKAKP